jgi:uncharacterized protein
MATTDTKREQRVAIRNIETRSEGEGPGTLIGYAAVFNQDAEIYGFIERVAPGAFAQALSEGQDVRALVDHDPGRIIGRSTNGTLRMSEDNIGLRVEIDLPDTTLGRDLYTSINRGDVSQMSFGFVVAADEWGYDGDMPTRTITRIGRLLDVSPVTFAAYEGTQVSARTAEAAKAGARAAGTRSRARAILALAKDEV